MGGRGHPLLTWIESTQSRGRACHGESAGGRGAIIQLCGIVRAHCASVMALARQVSVLTNIQGSRSPVNQLTNLTDSPDVSIAIRRETVEIEELRKKKESLIFQGIISANLDEARVKIAQVTAVILGSPLPIPGLVCIDHVKGIYRPSVQTLILEVTCFRRLEFSKSTRNTKIYI